MAKSLKRYQDVCVIPSFRLWYNGETRICATRLPLVFASRIWLTTDTRSYAIYPSPHDRGSSPNVRNDSRTDTPEPETLIANWWGNQCVGVEGKVAAVSGASSKISGVIDGISGVREEISALLWERVGSGFDAEGSSESEVVEGSKWTRRGAEGTEDTEGIEGTGREGACWNLQESMFLQLLPNLQIGLSLGTEVGAGAVERRMDYE